ncbi:IPP transferase-domain-containing protein [Dipodascopsis uninucleata]
MNNLISIIGTTGVGKSKLSIALARGLCGEIINADSMQVYNGLDTITNKHPVTERNGVSHHLLGHIEDRSAEYSLPQFESEAMEKIKQLQDAGKVPIVVGGTHYYMQSLVFKDSTVGSMQQRSLTDAEQSSLDNDETSSLFDQLRKYDPVIAEKFHPRDRRKIRRALEIFLTTGQRPSDIYKAQRLPNDLQTGDNMDSLTKARYNSLVFWIWCSQDVLDKRLDERVDAMVRNGNLIGEIKEMSELYNSSNPKPDLERGIWQVIGFKEFLPYIESQTDEQFEKGLEEMKRRTRKYARYQIRWIRRKFLVAASDAQQDVTVVILDATDLNKWDTSVEDRAIGIAQRFIKKEKILVEDLAVPELSDLLKPAREKDNSALPESWKHFECDICIDRDGNKFVCIGSDQWHIHTRSKRHRMSQKHLKEKEMYEQWKRNKGLE